MKPILFKTIFGISSISKIVVGFVFLTLPEPEVMGADTQKHGDDAVAHQTQILLPLLLPAFLGVVLCVSELFPVVHVLGRLSRAGREKDEYKSRSSYTNSKIFK